MRPSSIPAGDYVPTADQRVVIYGVPWSHFEEQLRLRGDAAAPRIAYLNGALELMSPSKDHERIKSFIGRLIEAYALETGIDLSPYGGWTLKNHPEEAGAEPDECYIIGADQTQDFPDLAIEVVWTHGGLNKLEIYKRLRIPEVWRWVAGAIEIYVLRAGRYELAPKSEVLPGLHAEMLTSFLDRPTALQAVRAFRQSLAAANPPAPIRARKPRRK